MTIVVANTKGGVGKTIISHHILPALFVDDDVEINVFEIDDNNRSVINDNNKKVSYKSIKINEMEDDVDKVKMDDLFSGDKFVNVIDCGGGNDTIAILNHLAKSNMDNITYIIPVNSDIEQVDNVIQTADLINSYSKNAKIILIFNRAKELSYYKEQFAGFFGSNIYDVAGRMKEVKDKIDDFFVLKESMLYNIIKNVYKTTFAEELSNYQYTVENSKELEREWAKKGMDYFKKQMKFFRLAKDALVLFDEIKPLKELIQSQNKGKDNE